MTDITITPVRVNPTTADVLGDLSERKARLIASILDSPAAIATTDSEEDRAARLPDTDRYRIYVRWTRKPGWHILPNMSRAATSIQDARSKAARASVFRTVQYVALHIGDCAFPDYVYKFGAELPDAEAWQLLLADD